MQHIIRKIKRRLKKILRIKEIYPSETSKVRYLVKQYCEGQGCDIGFGGDKIMKENCLGIDFEQPYTYTGKDRVDVACDIVNEEIPLPDNTFDYVYSSHLIEDIPNTSMALKKFIRVLKDGGNLILVFPDQPKYELHCKKTGQPLNMYHVHKNMGLDYMIKQLKALEKVSFKILFESDCVIDYNVIIAVKIFKK